MNEAGDNKSAVCHPTSQMTLVHQMSAIDEVQDLCTLY
jgi:hypothetical protein